MSSYTSLRQKIKDELSNSFSVATKHVVNYIFQLSKEEIVDIVSEIGVIPEDIGHDSTEEKLYTKASDAVFAKALELMNLEVKVLDERANSADIFAKSKFHNYTLIGDAKAFRLSRTARNAKDYKVPSMDAWRRGAKYSVLACPYFQYPNSRSQIYKEAIVFNVCLFAWEYLYIMLSEDIKESEELSLAPIWNQSDIIKQNMNASDYEKCFLAQQNINIASHMCTSSLDFTAYFNKIIEKMKQRGAEEITFYEKIIEDTKKLDREEAVAELIKALKIESKIDVISDYVNKVSI